MASATIGFSVDLNRDSDIIEWHRKQPNKSAAIRDVLTSHIHEEKSLGDVYLSLEAINARLDGIERMILERMNEIHDLLMSGRNIVMSNNDGKSDDEAIESEDMTKAKGALDKLGL